MNTAVRIIAEGVVMDSCSVALPLVISHGRSGMGAQPDAPTCTFTWADPPIPFALGKRVVIEQERAAAQTVTYDDPGVVWDSGSVLWDSGALGASTRFVGTVSGITAVERGGPVTQWEVRAVGDLAALGRKDVLITRPAENELARVAAIAAAAGITIHTLGAAQVSLAADTIDRDALSALHQVCESTAGLLWQARDGSIWYGTATHREIDPDRVIPCEAILDGLEWTQTVEQVINHVTVNYGPQTNQQQTTQSDADSLAQWGVRHADASTICATEADADRLALHILARRASPWWLMPGVMVPMDDLSLIDFDVVQDAEVSSAVLVPIGNIPDDLPTPLTDWVVEGWTESYDVDGHWMQLALSDRDRYGATGQRDWADAATFTWAQEAQRTWLEALVDVPFVREWLAEEAPR